MAKALVCNLCAGKGEAKFATIHAEGKVGLGKRARSFDADFCDEHGSVFAELVGKTASVEKMKLSRKPGPGRGATSRVPPDVTKRDILAFLVSATPPVKGPQIYAAVKSPTGATKQALLELRDAKCVLMTGKKNRAVYTLTKKGRDRTRPDRTSRKRKAPAAAAASAPPEQRAARRLRRTQAGRRRHRR